ncbi:MAG: DHHA1 domain-containing protein [Candidatus Parcubacteria bacterium]|nr:DHHA1 domain-containing protein [Candidatus Parcubacteria bacterium]
MHEHHKEIAVLYHGGCPDGFGGAYSAWKKFGDTAEYIPLKHGKPIPENLNDKDIYLIDFCYPQPAMDQLAETAKSITVLDHHEGVRDVAAKFPGIFDTNHSGATIAWSYFHPDVPVPMLLKYVETGDLYRFDLPNAREVLAYVYTLSRSFASLDEENTAQWDTFVAELENPAERARIVETGKLFAQYHEHVVVHGVNHAETVSFEGYECYLVGASGEFTSDIGNRLARLKPPIAIIVSADAEGLRVSLRSDGTVDVARLAQKYGGNGHPAASGFEIPFGNPIPWTVLEKHENPRD